MTRALGIYSAQGRAQVLSAGRKTPFLMVGTEMQAPAPLGTTVVLSFAFYGEDTKLDLKISSWQQRVSDSDFSIRKKIISGLWILFFSPGDPLLF